MTSNITLLYSVDNSTFQSISIYATKKNFKDYEIEDVFNERLLNGNIARVTRKRRLVELDIPIDSTTFTVNNYDTIMTFVNTQYKKVVAIDTSIPFSSDFVSNNSLVLVLKDVSYDTFDYEIKIIKIKLIEMTPSYL